MWPLQRFYAYIWNFQMDHVNEKITQSQVKHIRLELTNWVNYNKLRTLKFAINPPKLTTRTKIRI